MTFVFPGKNCRALAALLALLALALPLPLHAVQKACGLLLTAPDYDLELPLIGPVRDQCGGTCWLSAGLTMVEHSVHAQSGKEVALSEDYLTAMELKNQALSSVMNHVASVPTLQGRTFPHVEWLIREYGLVPKAEFSRPDTDWARVAEALHAAAKPYASKKNLSAAEYERMVGDVDAALEKELGALPESFRVGGKRYTPKTFGTTFVPARSFKTLFLKDKAVPDPLGLHHSLQDLLKQVKESLTAGKAIYASLRWPEQWYEADGGLLNLDSVPGAETKFAGLHAVAIVGAKVDAKGAIVALKIQGSWSAGSGDAGFYHISRKALEVVLQYVVIGSP